jgi:peptidoglycan/xylan/chitin deacetylase (PgdA/CDA1 family)
VRRLQCKLPATFGNGSDKREELRRSHMRLRAVPARARSCYARARSAVRRERALAGDTAVALAIALSLASGGCGGARQAASDASGHEKRASESGTAERHDLAARSAPASPLEPSGSSPEIRRLIALGKPIYCGGPRGNEVALTFDDGPGVYTRLALRKLRQAAMHATFFLVGRNLSLVPGAPREERALGMVGDHTFTHPVLPALTPEEAEHEIVSAQAAIARASGGPVFLFRPPYEAMDAADTSIVHAHHLLEILWDVDSQDSLEGDYAEIASKVIAGLKPGSIILMHENHGQTIRALPYIFAAIRRRHLRTVSVPSLLTEDPPSEAQLAAGWSGCGLTAAPVGGS